MTQSKCPADAIAPDSPGPVSTQGRRGNSDSCSLGGTNYDYTSQRRKFMVGCWKKMLTTDYQRMSKFQKMIDVYAIRNNELQAIDSLLFLLYILHK